MTLLEILTRLRDEAPTKMTLEEEVHVMGIITRLYKCRKNPPKAAAVFAAEGITPDNAEVLDMLDPHAAARLRSLFQGAAH